MHAKRVAGIRNSGDAIETRYVLNNDMAASKRGTNVQNSEKWQQ